MKEGKNHPVLVKTKGKIWQDIPINSSRQLGLPEWVRLPPCTLRRFLGLTRMTEKVKIWWVVVIVVMVINHSKMEAA